MAVADFASLCATAALLGTVSATLVLLINHEQPQPYMDEIFHVPQAQNYCVGNYSHWNPMITTLPGLYFFSILWVEPVAKVLSLPPPLLCTTPYLRSQNAVFIVLNFLTLYWLVRRLHGSVTASVNILTSLSLSSLPVLYFSSLLYYTDAGAVFFVLISYSLSLSHHHICAAFFSLVAILFRQTNILWMVFIAGVSFTRIFEHQIKGGRSLLSLLTSLPSVLPTALISLVPLWPYLLLCLVFAMFLWWNGSVVVGDKTHHQMHLHLPQIFYSLSFSACFSTPYLLGSTKIWRGFLRALKRPSWIVALVFMMCFCLVAVHYFTHVHPYLLADNRHYPFYVWKKIFQRHEAVKYLLVPVFSVIALFFTYALTRVQSQLWFLIFSTVCLLVLVPQKLLEFRYFIIPHILLRLHLPPLPSPLPHLLELLVSVAINAITLWLFLYQPFRWPDSEDWQRFMW